MTQKAIESSELLQAVVTVPKHVVFRSFPTETVVLNLRTGKYHGLNPTGGQMLKVLQAGDTVAVAAATIAESYDQPLEETERDIVAFCEALIPRGLIEVLDRDDS